MGSNIFLNTKPIRDLGVESSTRRSLSPTSSALDRGG